MTNRLAITFGQSNFLDWEWVKSLHLMNKSQTIFLFKKLPECSRIFTWFTGPDQQTIFCCWWHDTRPDSCTGIWFSKWPNEPTNHLSTSTEFDINWHMTLIKITDEFRNVNKSSDNILWCPLKRNVSSPFGQNNDELYIFIIKYDSMCPFVHFTWARSLHLFRALILVIKIIFGLFKYNYIHI